MNEFVKLSEIAPLVGIKELSIRLYHNQAERRRREDCSRFGDLPAPDRFTGQSPEWRRETIEQWISRRPGRGNRVKKNI